MHHVTKLQCYLQTAVRDDIDSGRRPHAARSIEVVIATITEVVRFLSSCWEIFTSLRTENLLHFYGY